VNFDRWRRRKSIATAEIVFYTQVFSATVKDPVTILD